MACYLYRYHLVSSLSTISLLVPSPMCTLDLPLNAGIQISTNVLLFNSAAAEKKKKRGKEKEKPNQTKPTAKPPPPPRSLPFSTKSLHNHCGSQVKKLPGIPFLPSKAYRCAYRYPKGSPALTLQIWK